MKLWRSKAGWCVAGLYLAVAVLLFLRSPKGFFGFNAGVLGLPWSELLVPISTQILVLLGSQGQLSNLLYPIGLYAPILFPIVLNASLLYLIGFGLERFFRYLPPRGVYRKDGP